MAVVTQTETCPVWLGERVGAAAGLFHRMTFTQLIELTDDTLQA